MLLLSPSRGTSNETKKPKPGKPKTPKKQTKKTPTKPNPLKKTTNKTKQKTKKKKSNPELYFGHCSFNTKCKIFIVLFFPLCLQVVFLSFLIIFQVLSTLCSFLSTARG